jgi:hypothetical protein
VIRLSEEELKIISLALKDLHKKIDRDAKKWDSSFGHNVIGECAVKTYSLMNRVDAAVEMLRVSISASLPEIKNEN